MFKIFKKEDNPKDILIDELKRSNKLFKILSTSLNDVELKEKADISITNINDIISYIKKSDIKDLKTMINKVKRYSKR